MKRLLLLFSLLAACGGGDASVAEPPPPAAPDAPPAAPAEAPPATTTPVTCKPPAQAPTFTVGTSVVTKGFVGFGAQYNQNLYAQITVNAGVDVTMLPDVETKAIDLAPRHVRVFFDSAALKDADKMQSFQRTIDLAQRSGATINVTYWHGPYDAPDQQMSDFANVLVDLVKNRAMKGVQYVTIQNEPNSTALTLPAYEQLYRSLDGYLAAAGLRPGISFVGGDLVSTNQDVWIAYMADHMGDVLDGWSIHVYWDWTDTAKLASRLADTRAQVDAMPASKRKPLYVTEFGVRGLTPTGTPSPGTIDGTPTESTIPNAFQHGWFDVLAAQKGFVAALKWDAYFAKYDNGTQRYAMIDTPDAKGVWPLTPVYHLTRMLDRAVRPGSDVVALDGAQDGVLAVAFRGPAGEPTVLGVNLSKTKQDFVVGGLLPHATFHALVWNAVGDGAVQDVPSDTKDACTVPLSLPPTTVFALTSLPP